MNVDKAKGIFAMTPLVLDFHTVVLLNSTSEFELTLQNDGRGTLNILSTKFSNPAFTFLQPVPTSIAPGAGTVVVQVGFTPTVAQGLPSGELTVKTD